MFKRILTAIVLLAATASFALFTNFPALQVGAIPTPQEITVKPKEPVLICPGPIQVNGGANGLTIGKFQELGKTSIFGKDAGNTVALETATSKALQGTETGSKNFNAIQLQNLAVKQARGLAATNCAAGTNYAWLVGGDNSVGREALLILANPSNVDATVTLQLYGTNGPIQGAGLSGISAPAGKVTVLPLASFAPKAATFAVEVSSRGAELGIWLQQKTIRGLTPGGIDLFGAAAPTSKLVEIPGLLIRNSKALSKLAKTQDDFNDLTPLLRVTAPSDKPANFTAQIQGADGTTFGTVVQGSVPAGSTRDFVIGPLADGDYSIHIESDEPVLASARFSRLSGKLPDFAWAVSVAAAKLDAGFTTATVAISKLSIVNPNASSAIVTLNGRKIEVSANSNLVLKLAAATNYSISSSLPVSASQVVDIKGAVAVIPITDYRSVGGQLKVSVR